MDTAIVVGLFTLAASIVTAAFALKGKSRETQVSGEANTITADANLRDDQREFIAQLRDENSKARDENTREREARGKLELEMERLRLEIDRLRLELHQTRAELDLERQARLAAQAANSGGSS